MEFPLNVRLTKLSLLLLIVVAVLDLGLSSTFHCRRKGQSCDNGGVCLDTGVCQCPENYSNYDCGVVTGNVNETLCNPACQNGGLCEVVADGPKCKCTEGFSGNDCAIQRVVILCGGMQRVICVDPVGFDGAVFITGKRNISECNFISVTGVSDPEVIVNCPTGLYLDIPDESTNCGNVTEILEGDKIFLERSVNIEFDTNIITSLDEILKARCEMDSLKAMAPVFVSPQYSESVYRNTSTLNAYEPLTFSPTLTDGAAMTDSPILIGTEIQFVFTIDADSGFESIILERLEANDTVGVTMNLVVNKCPAPDSSAIITSFVRDDTNRTITLKMKVFKFIATDQIAFTMMVRICKAGDTACFQVMDCTNQDFQGFGRRKRDSGDEMTMVKTVRVTDDPTLTAPVKQETNTGDCPAQTDREEEIDDSCLESSEIIIVIAMLSFVIIVLFIVCLVLTRKVLNSGPKVLDIYPTDSYSTTSLQRPHF